MCVEFSPIGFVRTPFKEPSGIPIQNRGGKGIEGTVEILDEYIEGLSDLDGFSHIILITHLHRSEGYKLKVFPFLENRERGVFSTRAPKRPNPLGLHIVRLDGIQGGTLHIRDIDMIDGTPVLDIKPYFPYIDEKDEYRIGWAEGKIERFDHKRSDDRFTK